MEKLMFGRSMRVAITGTTGRVGAALAKHFSQVGEVVELPRGILDFSNPEGMAGVLDRLQCDVLLNPGGLTSLEACEDSPDLARQLNVEAPARLAGWASERGVKLVHFSTDYVFGGRTPELRVESDETEPLSVYGASKWAGEQEVLAHPGHLVARVSWVFGPEKPSFIDGVVRDALAGKPLSAVADKWSLPTHTADLSRSIEALLERNAEGVFHVCQSGEPASWRDLAEVAVQALVEAGKLKTAPPIEATRLAENRAFRAERPKFTAMSTRKLEECVGETLRDWRESVRSHVSECR